MNNLLRFLKKGFYFLKKSCSFGRSRKEVSEVIFVIKASTGKPMEMRETPEQSGTPGMTARGAHLRSRQTMTYL